jgi:hypothetical protein
MAKKPPLSVVGTPLDPAAITVQPPRKLGKAGFSRCSSVQSEIRIDDIGGVELLMQICLAADRVAELAAQIDRDGVALVTRSGIRAHPCLREELSTRAFIVRTLGKLGLTDEVIKPMGRPPQPLGWRGPHAD